VPGEPNASPFPYHPDYASLWASVELRAYPTSFLATGSAPRPGQVPAQGDTGSVGELDVEDDHGRAQGGNPDQGIGHRARLADNLEPYRPAHARGRSPRAPPSPRSTAAEPRDEERALPRTRAGHPPGSGAGQQAPDLPQLRPGARASVPGPRHLGETDRHGSRVQRAGAPDRGAGAVPGLPRAWQHPTERRELCPYKRRR
jgi:hypothetical protein